MFALVRGCERFRPELYGQHFKAYIDNQAVVHALKSGKWEPGRYENNFKAILSEYDFEPIHLAGAHNPADAPSRLFNGYKDVINKARIAINEVRAVKLEAVSLEQLELEQRDDDSLKIYFDILENRYVPRDELTTEIVVNADNMFIDDGGALFHRWRNNSLESLQSSIEQTVVPTKFRRKLIEQAHDGNGHQSSAMVINRLLYHYWWPSIRVDVTQYIQSCQRCAEFRLPSKLQKAPIQMMMHEGEPGDVVHWDVASMRDGYLFQICDAASGWVELCALNNKDATSVARAVVNEWIYRHGKPRSAVKDNGGENAAAVTREIMALFEILDIRTTVDHPESNAKAERKFRMNLSSLQSL